MDVGRFLETNSTGQLVNSPINIKNMHCDWLLSIVSIAARDLTEQLVIGPFQKPGINRLMIKEICTKRHSKTGEEIMSL
jgi:hypothetical protein